MDRATYLEEIVAAYQGEVRGEATFATQAQGTTSADELEIWQTLARLEAATRQRLMPLLQRHGLDTTPDEEQRRIGQARGEARLRAGFAATIQAMTERLPPFVARYARLEAEGLAEDQAELAFLNAHEVALYAFTARALAGGGRESLAPVWALLGE